VCDAVQQFSQATLQTGAVRTESCGCSRCRDDVRRLRSLRGQTVQRTSRVASTSRTSTVVYTPTHAVTTWQSFSSRQTLTEKSTDCSKSAAKLLPFTFDICYTYFSTNFLTVDDKTLVQKMTAETSPLNARQVIGSSTTLALTCDYT